MNRLLVLTSPTSGAKPDPEIILRRGEREPDTYIYVDTIDGLIHYRHDGFPEVEARLLMA